MATVRRRRSLGAKREFAERYLLIMIASFATTVAATRWYLDVAGYPTIGGGELHVAHVLWGGLALVVAVALPMIFVGQRASMLSALLGGIGVGLFIDEVGKFLTTSNDYFYAPAAPIIYGGILLLVLLWAIVRRLSGSTTGYDANHRAIEALRDSVDGSLTRVRRDRAIHELRAVDPDATSDGPSMGAQLMATLESHAVEADLSAQGWVASDRPRELLEQILPARIERPLILFGLAWSALQAVVAVAVLVVSGRVLFGGLEVPVDPTAPLEFPTEPIWSVLMLGIMVVVGVGNAAAISLLRRGREREAMNIAVIAVLVGMIAGDLVAFYAYQIGALASTVLDLLLLGLIIDYRIRIDRREVAG